MKDLFEDKDRQTYSEALGALREAGIDFMVGGAFAVYHYTDWWRDTHDVDVYVVPEDVPRAADALKKAGFDDLGEQAPGDRGWIYHAGKNTIIFDVIFRFANYIDYITPSWFERAPQAHFLGMDIKFLPLEELVWVKLFVINRHRCDWPDVMRVVRAQCHNLNWSRLVEMLGENWLLLAGLIDVFDWQNPGAMDCVPDDIREEFTERRTDYRAHPVNVEREHLLDPWMHQRADQYAVWRDE